MRVSYLFCYNACITFVIVLVDVIYIYMYAFTWCFMPSTPPRTVIEEGREKKMREREMLG